MPKTVAGYNTIETLVIDDGSTDQTAEVARHLGATHVLKLPHRGLAQTFIAGLHHTLAAGAHTVVNIDADNQYSAGDIATITAPIVTEAAGVVFGERPLSSMQNLSFCKRQLHQAGNALLRQLSGTNVTDATSGFRALRHDVAHGLHIRSTYTYTVEMLLELSLAGVPITFVPIRVNRQQLRPSRLIQNNAEYVCKTACIVVRTLIRSRRFTSQSARRARGAWAALDRVICSPVVDFLRQYKLFSSSLRSDGFDRFAATRMDGWNLCFALPHVGIVAWRYSRCSWRATPRPRSA